MPKTITQLPAGTTVVDSSLVESVEGGASVKFTALQVQTYLAATFLTQADGLTAATAASTYQTIANVPVLTSDTTFYVRTDGNDSNTGLTNDAAGAWLTIQHALNSVANYIIRPGVVATIQIGDGTYSASNTVRNIIGGGTIVVNGNSGTPANVIIQGGAAAAFIVNFNGYTFRNMELRSTSNHCMLVSAPCMVTISTGMIFGAAGASHFRIVNGGNVTLATDYTIAGNAVSHFSMSRCAQVTVAGVITGTVSGTPAFTTFCLADVLSLFSISAGQLTYSGAATGVRYSATLNSVINTAGGGANFFPGDNAGSVATGGLYA